MSKKVLKFRIFVLAVALLPVISFVSAEAVEYSPTDDTFVDEYAPNTNYGSAYYLIVRSMHLSSYELDTLLKFDLSAIRSDATIKSAKLNLYFYHYNDSNPGGDSLGIHRITQDWSEGTAKWILKPTYDPVATTSVTAPGTVNTWVQWDVTTDVQDFVDGTKTNYGWQIMDATLSDSMIYFYAKEYNADPNLRPYLEVEVECTGQWGYHASDLNRDCYVTMSDFAIMAEQWLWSSNPDDPNAKPSEQTFIGAGFVFDGNDTTGPARILTLYDDLNEDVLEPNDIILEYRDQAVATGEELLNVIKNTDDVEPGETIKMLIQRAEEVMEVWALQDIHFESGMACWLKCVNRLCVKAGTSGGETTCACTDYSTYDCWHTMSHVLVHHSVYARSGYATATVECYNEDDMGNKYNQCVATADCAWVYCK